MKVDKRKFLYASSISTAKAITQNKNIKSKNSCILIGPEGDFTEAEVKKTIKHGFREVSLGTSRLRTETAGLVSSIILNLKQ